MKMMKRTGVPRLGPDEPSPLQAQNAAQLQQAGASSLHSLAQPHSQPILNSNALVSVGGFGRGSRGAAPVLGYMKPGALQYAPPKQPPPQMTPRIKAVQPPVPPAQPPAAPPQAGGGVAAPPAGAQSPGPQTQFQRLKVEDALSYLDQVKYKFNTQPQVYNDFLDIMKEFKSQTIDTPGVITRVSNLFKGHPELIVGFNTFLPPGYKIEVQSNGQVSVSMPSPTAIGSGVLLGVHHTQQPQLVHLLPVPHAEECRPVGPALQHLSHAAPDPALHHATGPPVTPTPTAPPGQPVEFNHAIEYVNKIKSRFSRQPDKYKRFLEILHAYQRGHRDLKEPQAKQQTEQEVYSQVAKLFEHQEDLLAEFGQFLPDAKAVTKPEPAHEHHPQFSPGQPPREVEPERFAPAVQPEPAPMHLQHALVPKHVTTPPAVVQHPQHHHLKRSPSISSTGQPSSAPPPAKKPRASCLSGATVRDVSYSEAAKLATIHDYSFFERARKALRSQQVYDNFLRCLLLFTNEIISSSELLSVTSPFLCRHPELQRWLHDFVGPPSPPHTPTHTPNTGYPWTNPIPVEPRPRYESVGALGAQMRNDRPQGDMAMDIDLSTCKRLGTSYCALPREAAARKCSGRTPLCKEVLNDTWVSFPTWSEDSTFVTSRKTQYEEYIYRCEDERFELDVVIETNAATIRVLEGVQKKLSRMSGEDAARYRLDDCLGGHSPTVHQRALRRIYGDKAVDIIAGLKKNPVVAVPVVLRRLKAKEEEWREAQKGFNKQWREQNEKYYLKSLDHQGINFKQNDLKAMRSKTLFNEVESAYAARRPGPHLVVDYNMQSRQEAIKIVRDTAELLIHHARRQTAIQKAEKRRIKQLLRHFLPDLFSHPRQPLSDDEKDEDKEDAPSPECPIDQQGQENDKNNLKQEIKQESSESDNASDKSGKNGKNNKENKPKNNNNLESNKESVLTQPTNGKRLSNDDQILKSDLKTEPFEVEDDLRDHPPNEGRFVCTSSWYLFLRVHGALCQRLAAARRAMSAAPPARPRHDRPPALALRLAPAHHLPADVSSPTEYYNLLLDLVKGVLDGNMESSAFEDAAREMLGIKAYPAYTLDKLVSIAVRQLQHCASEPWSVRAAELCARDMRAAAGPYVRRALAALRPHHAAFLVRAYGGDECKVTFELLESAGEGRTSPHNNDNRMSPTAQRTSGGVGGVKSVGEGEAVSRCAAWSLYAERFASNKTSGVTARGKPVFLARNARARGLHAPANTSRWPQPPRRPAPRRKPAAHDAAECTLAELRCRLVACRPFRLLQRGALAAARATHERLSRRRRDRFRAWLDANRPHLDERLSI